MTSIHWLGGSRTIIWTPQTDYSTRLVVLTLVQFPRLGARRPHLRRPAMELRRIPVPGFPHILVVYEVSERTETVIIHRVLDGRRDLGDIL